MIPISDDVWRFLEFKNINTSSSPIKTTKISKLVDPAGGSWQIGIASQVPCGCQPETIKNGYRLMLSCPNHPESGILIQEFETGEWWWTSGQKREVKK